MYWFLSPFFTSLTQNVRNFFCLNWWGFLKIAENDIFFREHFLFPLIHPLGVLTLTQHSVQSEEEWVIKHVTPYRRDICSKTSRGTPLNLFYPN